MIHAKIEATLQDRVRQYSKMMPPLWILSCPVVQVGRLCSWDCGQFYPRNQPSPFTPFHVTHYFSNFFSFSVHCWIFLWPCVILVFPQAMAGVGHLNDIFLYFFPSTLAIGLLKPIIWGNIFDHMLIGLLCTVVVCFGPWGHTLVGKRIGLSCPRDVMLHPGLLWCVFECTSGIFIAMLAGFWYC